MATINPPSITNLSARCFLRPAAQHTNKANFLGAKLAGRIKVTSSLSPATPGAIAGALKITTSAWLLKVEASAATIQLVSATNQRAQKLMILCQP